MGWKSRYDVRPGTSRWDKMLERWGELPYQQREREQAAPLPSADNWKEPDLQQTPVPAPKLGEVQPLSQATKVETPAADTLPQATLNAQKQLAEIQARPRLKLDTMWGYKSLPYKPTYWQDPKNVVQWKTMLEANPGMELPAGVSRDAIEGAYNWMKYRNFDKEPSQWVWLHQDDPALPSLADLPNPPADLMSPTARNAYAPQADKTGKGAAGGDYTRQDFQWQDLTTEQKQTLISDPSFNLAAVTAPNQQSLIVSDPAFDLWGKVQRKELPWWQEAAYIALSNPKTAGIAQGALVGGTLGLIGGPVGAGMGALTGAAFGAAGTAGMLLEQSDSWALRAVGKLINVPMQAMMFGVQATEQTAGFFFEGELPTFQKMIDDPEHAADIAAEFIKSTGGPGGMVSGAAAAILNRPINELTDDEKMGYANWLAGRSYYLEFGAKLPGIGDVLAPNVTDEQKRLANNIFPLFKPVGEVFIAGKAETVPVLPNYTWDDARQRIIDGEAPDIVLMDYQRAYGLSGAFTQNIGYMVADPLQAVAPLSSIARTKLHLAKATAIEARMRPLELEGKKYYITQDLARAQIERLHAQAAAQTMTVTGELLPWSETSKAFRDLVRTRFDKSSLTTPELAKQLTRMERNTAFLTPDGKLMEFEPTKPGYLNLMRNLTPESKAVLSAHFGAENLAKLLDWAGNDEQVGRKIFSVLDKAASGDMKQLHAAGLGFMDTPEFYTIVGALKDFKPEIENLVGQFETTRPNRELLQQVLALMGEEDQRKMVVRFTDGDPTTDFNAAVTSARTLAAGVKDAPGYAEAVALLKEVDAGRLTADVMAKTFAVFKDKPELMSPTGFKYLVTSKFVDHMGTWGVKHFSVGKAGQVEEVLRGLKGVQSMLLLDMSPSYFVNNFLNNRILMAAGGVFGFNRGSTMDGWFRDFGITPDRLSQGFGPTGEPLAGGAKTPETRIREARRGRGLGTTMADAVGAIRGKIAVGTRLSGKVEGASSKQLFYSTMKKFYGRNWRQGVGFREMPRELVDALRAQGVDPDIIYNQVRGMMTPGQLEQLSKNATSRNAQQYVADASAALGVDAADSTEMLNGLGVMDDLEQRIRDAKTVDDVAKIINQVEQKAQDNLIVHQAAEIRGLAEHQANKIKAEGYAGAHNILMDLSMDLEARWLEHYTDAGELVDWSSKITDPKVRNNAWREWRRKEQGFWDQYYAQEAASWKGLFEGLGVQDARAREFLHKVSQYMDTNRNLTAEQMGAYDEYFGTQFDTPEKARAAFAALEKRFDRRWRAAERAKATVWKQLDQMTIDIYKGVFGADIEKSVTKWVKEKAAWHKLMVKAKEDFQASLSGLSGRERKARKWSFWQQEYPEMIKLFTDANQRNETAIYRGLAGQPELPTADQVAAQARREQIAGQRAPAPKGPSAGAQALDALFAAEPEKYGTPGAITPEQQVARTAVEAAAPTEATNAPEVPQQRLAQPAPEAVPPAETAPQAPPTTDEAARAIVEEQAAAGGMRVVPEPPTENVAAITARHELPTVDASGQVNYANEMHVMNILKRYDGPEGKALKRSADIYNVDPEIVNAAFAERQRIHDMQIKMVLDTDTPADRRSTTFDPLRQIWNELSPEEQQAAVSKILTDEMTGLETLHSMELDKQAGGGRPEGYVDGMLDLNAMKAINDHFGHDAGNQVLRAVGQAVRDELPAGARGFRVGGDEFQLWLPADQAGAILKAVDERFSKAVFTFDVDGKQVKLEGFTVSYGQGGDIKSADAALYADKARRLGLGERAERGQLPGSIHPVHEAAGPDGTLAGREAAAEKQQAVKTLVHSAKLKDLPDDIRPHIQQALERMRLEATRGRATSLLEAIADAGGINMDYIRDVTGEGKAQRGWPIGLFSRRKMVRFGSGREVGFGMDTMAQYMHEAGYISDADFNNPADMGGVNKLTEMIKAELGGEKQLTAAARESNLPEQLPEWYKNIRVKATTSKKEAVAATITRMLDGYDNTSVGLPETALERAVKDQAFEYLHDLAAEDGAIADATGLPFNYDWWAKDVLDKAGEMRSYHQLEDLQAISSDLDTLLNRLPEGAPEDMPTYWVDQNNVINDRMAELEQQAAIEKQNALAEVQVRELENQADRIEMRDQYRELIKKAFDYPEDAIERYTQLTEAYASTWARRHNSTPEEWYRRHIADMVNGGDEATLLQSKARGILPRDPTLLVRHNLSEAGLAFADGMDGLAMPSVAITRGEDPYFNYGEITLLADKRLIDPGNRDNMVRNADQYAPRMPEIRYDVKDADVDVYYRAAQDVLNSVAGKDAFRYGHRSPDYQLSENIADEGVRAIENDPAVMAQWLKDNNLLPVAPDRGIIEKLVRSDEHRLAFAAYAQRLLDAWATRKKFFAGWTYSGNKRWKEYNMENIVRYMRSKMGESEASMFGAGALRAKVTKRFKTYEAIRKAKGQLTSQADMEIVKQEFSDRLAAVIQEHMKTAVGRGDDNPFINADRFVEAISEGAKTGRLESTLEDWGFSITATGLKDIRDLLTDLQKAPTQYFEAKLLRAVQLQEFTTAIVPGDATPETRAILKKHGLKVVEYERTGTADEVNAARQAATQKATVDNPDLLWQDANNRIKPVTRQMDNGEVDNYARALVRAGADELRRAVQNETTPADRRRLLDFARRYDPDMALEVARNMRDMLFQDEPQWYMKSLETVQDLKQETLTVDQLRAALKKGGVNEEEMYWSGLGEWLEARGTPKLTKQLVLDYLEAHDRGLTFRMRGQDEAGARLPNIDDARYLHGEVQANEPDVEFFKEAAVENYDGWLSDYAEYRGMDLNDPEQAAEIDRQAVIDYAVQIQENEYYNDPDQGWEQDYTVEIGDFERDFRLEGLGGRLSLYDQTAQDFVFEDKPERRTNVEEEIRDYLLYQELVRTSDSASGDAKWGPGGEYEIVLPGGADGTYKELEVMAPWVDPGYRSPHWEGDRNVMWHTRFEDRVDAQGNKVLFVMEFQNDWVQEGGKAGFRLRPGEVVPEWPKGITVNEDLGPVPGAELNAPEGLKVYRAYDREGKLIAEAFEKDALRMRMAEYYPNDFIPEATKIRDLKQNLTQEQRAHYAVARETYDTYKENASQLGISLEATSGLTRTQRGREITPDLEVHRNWPLTEDLRPTQDTESRTIATIHRSDDDNARPEVTMLTTDPDEMKTVTELVDQMYVVSLEWNKLNDAGEDYAKFTSKIDVNRWGAAMRGDSALVSDVPFKKTWPKMAMKLMLKYAVEHGYKKLTFATGQVAAEVEGHTITRYQALRYVPDTETIFVQERGSPNWHEQTIEAGKTLEDYVGADIAKQLNGQPLQKMGGSLNSFKQLETNDIVWGGEKMRWFYDGVLLNQTNDVLKKFGVRVGKTSVNKEAVHTGVGANKNKLYGDSGYAAEMMDVNSIDITPEMEASFKKAQAMQFQPGRGGISWNEDGKAIIHAFEAKDLSTLAHELGHIFRRDLEGPDLDIVEEWAGVKDGNWERAHEEQFARGFERYLAEGKAPTAALTKVFASFKTWLMDIYGMITGSKIDVKLTDEVRGVFDRMLGAEEKAALPQAEQVPAALPGVKWTDTTRMEQVAQGVQADAHIDAPAALAQVTTAEAAPTPMDELLVKTGFKKLADGKTYQAPLTTETKAATSAVMKGREVPTARETGPAAATKAGKLPLETAMDRKIYGAIEKNPGLTTYQVVREKLKVPYKFAAENYSALSALADKGLIVGVYDAIGDIHYYTPDKAPKGIETTKTFKQKELAGQAPKQPSEMTGFDRMLHPERSEAVKLVPTGEPQPSSVEADYVPLSDLRDFMVSSYYKDGVQVESSRTAPVQEVPYVPGTWFVDDIKGIYGRMIEELVLLDPNTLKLTEEDFTKVNYEGRGTDAQRYAGWMKEGKTPPPITVMMDVDGTYAVIDGHRRVAAAKLAGAKQVPAIVSYPMDTGKKDSAGKPIYTSLTYEGVKYGAPEANRMWEAGQQQLLERVKTPSSAEPAAPERYLAETPEGQAIVAKIDAITNLGKQRREANTARELYHLKPSDYDWLTSEERTQLSNLQAQLRTLSSEEAKQRVLAKRAARVQPEQPALTPEEAGTVDTGTAGGLLPGMREAAGGMLFDVQPGTAGQRTKMEAPNARPNTEPVPGKTALDKNGVVLNPGDLIVDKTGMKHIIKGVAWDGYLISDKGLRVPRDGVKRLGSQNMLFQDGGNIPVLPPGGYDQTSGFANVSNMKRAGWREKVSPLLDAMGEAARSPERRVSMTGLDDRTQKMLNVWLNDVRGDMASTKHATVRWGETWRDYALLNYEKQYGFDKVFSAFVPYQLWMTHSFSNWVVRGLDHPMWFANMAKIASAHNTYQSQLPERLRDKIKIPMPFLPEWMGSGMWIDPTLQLFPWKQYTQPLQNYERDVISNANNAEYVVRSWVNDGTLSQAQGQAALKHAGPDWQRALAQSQQENSDGSSPYDYFSMMFSPALYLTIPYYLATKKAAGGMGWPNGQLPITRFGGAMETALKGTSLDWVGKAAGALAKPENLVREKMGLPEFGQWGDYYIDRQLTNMTIEGKYTSQEATQAMIERSGPIYQEALARVRQELMLKVPTMAPVFAVAQGATLDQVIGALLPSLFPGGILPPAEMQAAGLKAEYNLAWKARAAGDSKALNKFFEEHPEYEARLALRNSNPQDRTLRLNNFLKSSIWDAYNGLGKTNRKQVTAALGPQFQDFLGSEPGVEFTTEQLTTWAKMLNQAVPVTQETTPTLQQNIQPVPLYDERTTQLTDQFYADRTAQFPLYYSMEQGYYSKPKSERAAYLVRFPQLKAYWDWKASWKRNHPELAPIITGQVFRNLDTSNWAPPVLQQVQLSALTGDRLPSGVEQILRQYWEQQGRPYGNFSSWLNSEVLPSVKNQMTGNLGP